MSFECTHYFINFLWIRRRKEGCLCILGSLSVVFPFLLYYYYRETYYTMVLIHVFRDPVPENLLLKLQVLFIWLISVIFFFPEKNLNFLNTNQTEQDFGMRFIQWDEYPIFQNYLTDSLSLTCSFLILLAQYKYNSKHGIYFSTCDKLNYF